MKKSRKNRIDSVTAEVAMIQAKPPKPPDYIKLKAKELPFWNSIINAKAFDSWTEPDLEIAANLARCKADIERLQNEIRIESDIMMNAAGSPIINPKHKLIQDLIRQSIALSRLIQIHAAATIGQPRHQARRNQKQRELQDTLKGLSPLIAPPIN